MTVRVKMKGMDTPILLSRNYLPEIKEYSTVEFLKSIDSRTYVSKTKGHSYLYDYQMKRIKEICDYFLRNYPSAR